MYNPYAVTYDARMTVWRFKDIQVGGYTRQELYTVAKWVPCRYSSSGQVPTGSPNPSIQNSHKLFCGLMQMYRRVTGLLSPSEQEKL